MKDNLHHVVSLEKRVMRHNMIKYGFIRPENITLFDFKLSFAHCLEEEQQINKDEPHQE